MKLQLFAIGWTNTLIELLILCAILALLVGIIAGTGGGCNRSDGVRVGTLTKFSYKGIWNATKSWEGCLAMEGVATGDCTLAVNWNFSVLDKAVAEQLESKMGQPVRLRYRQTLFYAPWKRSTAYLVIRVE